MSERDPESSTAPPRPRAGWKRKLRILWPFGLLAFAVLLTFFGEPGRGNLPTGTDAPTLVVPWSGGSDTFQLEAHRGEVVVLAFWATWCPACRTEGPTLSALSRRLADEGEPVVGVSVDEAPLPDIVAAARRYGMSYPIARATRADTDRFGVDRLPTIYVIDTEGRIAASFVGPVSEDTVYEAVLAARDRRVAGL